MNTAHLHLLLNHLPVLGVPFGLALLLASLRRLNPAFQRAGLLVLVLAGVAAGLAYLTGEPAEAVLRQLGLRPEAAIEAHEEAATVGLIAAGTLGLLALGAWWRSRRQTLGRPALLALLFAGVVVSGTLAWVANLGGQIRHQEIRGGAATGWQQEADEK